MACMIRWHVCASILLFLLFRLTLSNPDNDGEPEGYMRREYSVTKPFVGGSSMQFWEILGQTVISDDYIRLTSDEQSATGGIWNIMPVYIRDWEIHLHFHIHGHSSRLFGDGFGFWYTKDRAEIGPVFGGKDYFSGLAILFDTYANQNGEHAHEHPYISAQVNNGSLHYDHDRDGTHSELAGCTSHFRGVDADTYVAIRYLGSKNRLTVQYDVEGEDRWIECFDQYGVELPTGYYFGFTASTGDLSDTHDILSMKFYELDSPEGEGGDQDEKDYSKIIPKARNAEGEREHVDDPPMSTRKQKALGWVTVILVIVAIAGLVGFFFYQKQQKDNLKRFY